MSRVPVPLAFAALLLLATPLAVAAADDPSLAQSSTTEAQAATTVVGLSENTSRIFPLPGAQRSNFTAPDASVMASIRMGVADATWTLSRESLARTLDAATTQAERQRVLENATENAASAVDALLERERAARRAYLDGDSTAERYVTTLGELQARADHLLSYIGPRNDPARHSLLSYADRGSALRATLFSLQAEVTPLVTDTGASAAFAVRGGFSDRFSVLASPDGFALSTISDGLYQRTVYRPDLLDSTVDRTVSITDLGERTDALYPWALAGDGFVSSGTYTFDGYAYRVRITHLDGTIISYVDASSGQPYHETRETALSVVATDPGWTNTSGNYTLAVNRSYPGGPLRVSVTHNGSAVRAPISIGGARVGTTGVDDGVLWTLAPRGEFTVTATVDGREVRVNATAT
ncbi:hypothetical protein [Salarchaeum sp. JOR-1]|uniref:DUF7094 domain-containing protein n=1 Tax=Salarchaeum sp. JOR-1 TaxID=2599399 RepID=UPI0011989D7C|nr:hypothetical protein [Salarchaeum sp. JOR-1]QDX40370.1 hypothetical protein FQU85_05455 [Salarchaeum sp. JOR-1]